MLLMKLNVLHDDSVIIVLIGSVPWRAFDYAPVCKAQALTLERNDSTIPSMTYSERIWLFPSTLPHFIMKTVSAQKQIVTFGNQMLSFFVKVVISRKVKFLWK